MSNARNLARLLPNASGQLPDAAMSSGSVLQVVNFYTTADSSTTSNSYVDSNISASITPSSATSKILVMTWGTTRKSPGNVESAISIQVLRNGSAITSLNNLAYTQTSSYAQESIALQYLDSPATTSALTYKVQLKSNVNGITVQLSHDGSNNGITLMEIAA